MNKVKLLALPVLALFVLSSCSSVRVLADYDKEADFQSYKTYAFYKTGIDKAEISDLDKKRILKAIDDELSSRGYVKSKNPDMLISIFTKERQRVDVYNNNAWAWGGWGWGWGGGFWNPWIWGPGWGWGGPGWNNGVSTTTEGSLYIDVIDARAKELVWQGRGVGTLNNTDKIDKKEERIKKFVSQILRKYPPDALASN